MRFMMCDNCNKKFKELRKLEEKLICYGCYNTIRDLTFGKGLKIHSGIKFNEVLIQRANLNITLNITDSQFSFLKIRILQLGITKTEYVRELIINDMLNQEESRYGVKTGELN